MKKKIGVIDIKMGNLYSIEKALNYLDINYVITSNNSKLEKCERYILPGVGAFGAAMKNLKHAGLDDFILNQVEKGKNILGICLGMQLLGSSSLEFGKNVGLNINNLNYTSFKNKVNKLDFHIGFNQVKYPKNSKLFQDIDQNSDFYFLHGFSAKPKKETKYYGLTKYQYHFVSSYENLNVFGVQFHPEKSKMNGIKILQNFIKYKC